MNKNIFKKAKKPLLLVIFLLILFLISGRLLIAKNKKNLPQTTIVKRKNLISTLSASGKIESDEQVTLRFQTSGQLAWVGVKKGDYVKKWQAIASLDKKELQKRLEKELLKYLNERWDFEKIMNIDYKDQALTEAIRIAKEKAQFDLDLTVKDVELADIALKYATLITPIEGIVIKVDTPFSGVNITPATAEFVIANPQKIVFIANIDEADIGQVQVGQQAKIILDAYPEEEIATQVSQIDFSATSTSGGGTAFGTKFLITQENQKYKLGMNGDVEIIVQEKPNVLVVPLKAIQKNGQEKYVEVIVEGKKQKRSVTTGLEVENEVEIVAGLEEGEKIIIPEKE